MSFSVYALVLIIWTRVRSKIWNRVSHAAEKRIIIDTIRNFLPKLFFRASVVLYYSTQYMNITEMTMVDRKISTFTSIEGIMNLAIVKLGALWERGILLWRLFPLICLGIWEVYCTNSFTGCFFFVFFFLTKGSTSRFFWCQIEH